jgi:hypothetical protein
MPGLDPPIVRSGLHTAREVISGRQISYPVPYLAVILACFSAACLIIALFAARLSASWRLPLQARRRSS